MESACGVLSTCTPLDKNKCQYNYIKTSVSSASSGYHEQYNDSKVTIFECVQSAIKWVQITFQQTIVFPLI